MAHLGRAKARNEELGELEVHNRLVLFILRSPGTPVKILGHAAAPELPIDIQIPSTLQVAIVARDERSTRVARRAQAPSLSTARP